MSTIEVENWSLYTGPLRTENPLPLPPTSLITYGDAAIFSLEAKVRELEEELAAWRDTALKEHDYIQHCGPRRSVSVDGMVEP
jgi:hypothetical protein